MCGEQLKPSKYYEKYFPFQTPEAESDNKDLMKNSSFFPEHFYPKVLALSLSQNF